MIEKISLVGRSLTTVGLAAGSLALGVGCIEAKTTPQKNSSLINKNHPLHVGSNISQVQMLSPEVHKDTKFRLKPESESDIEDLAIVFDRRESDILISSLGEPVQGDSVGFVLESNLGKTTMKLVFFKTKTGEINLVSPAVPLNSPQNLFGYVDPHHPSESYKTFVKTQSSTRKDITVGFKHTHPAKATTI